VYDSDGVCDERQVVTPLIMRQATKRLLRRSLRAHVSEIDGLSSERLLTIEYSLSLPRPSDSGRNAMPDWVGCVAGVGSQAAGGLFVSGCYDGRLRVSTGNATTCGDVAAHVGAVKAVKAAAGGLIVSGGHDQSVRVWRLDQSGDQAVLTPVRELAVFFNVASLSDVTNILSFF
jgi:hypothetical protein